MTTNANITPVNSNQDLECLADRAVVLVNVRSRENVGYIQSSPTALMLHEKIKRKGIFGTRQGHRFIGVVKGSDASPDKIIMRYDIYGRKGVSFDQGAVYIDKERAGFGFILPGQLQYQQTESQLRQAGLYHG